MALEFEAALNGLQIDFGLAAAGNSVQKNGFRIALIEGFDNPLEGNLLLTGAYRYAKTELKNIAATPAELLAIDPGYVLFGVEESNTLTDAAPRTRATFTASWDTTQWSLLGRVSRHGSAKRVFNFGGGFEPEQTYGAEWQLDAEVEYRVSPKWSVALGGLNLTDEYPDLSSADISYFGNLPYDVLSPIGSNGAYYYTRVRYTF